MLTLLYDLPNWLVGLLVSGSAIALSLGAYFLFLRASKTEFTDDDRNRALAVLAVVATINSLLLAFSAVSVWESFGAAEEAVVAQRPDLAPLGAWRRPCRLQRGI